MVQDITEKPKPETVRMFDGLLNGFRESEVSRAGYYIIIMFLSKNIHIIKH